MSLRPTPRGEVAAATAAVARAAFARGNRCLERRDALGPIFEDGQFKGLFAVCGRPAECPWRLALATLLPFAEDLSDRRAADAVRGRIVVRTGSRLSGPIRASTPRCGASSSARLGAGGAEALLFEPPRRSRRRSRWAFHAAMAASSSCSEQRAPAAAGGTGPMGPRRRRWSSQRARSLLRADLRFGGGERHRLEAAPGPPPADRLGLEEPDHGLGRRVVERAPRPAPPDLRPPRARRRPRRGAPRTGGRGAGRPPSERATRAPRPSGAGAGGGPARARPARSPRWHSGAPARPATRRAQASVTKAVRTKPGRAAARSLPPAEAGARAPTRRRSGAGAGNGRLARSGGPGAAGSRTVVLTAPPARPAPRSPIARIRLLDPVGLAGRVDERDHRCDGRSSAAIARCAEAFLRISLAPDQVRGDSAAARGSHARARGCARAPRSQARAGRRRPARPGPQGAGAAASRLAVAAQLAGHLSRTAAGRDA